MPHEYAAIPMPLLRYSHNMQLSNMLHAIICWQLGLPIPGFVNGVYNRIPRGPECLNPDNRWLFVGMNKHRLSPKIKNNPVSPRG